MLRFPMLYFKGMRIMMFQLYGFYSIVIEEGLTSSKHLAPRHQRHSWTRCIVIALIWAADSNLCPPNIQVLNRASLTRNGEMGFRVAGLRVLRLTSLKFRIAEGTIKERRFYLWTKHTVVGIHVHKRQSAQQPASS